MGELVGERRREIEKERERDREREGGVKQMCQHSIPSYNEYEHSLKRGEDDITCQ